MTDQYASARLGLPYMQAAQAQKHITHNQALERLDVLAQLTVESFSQNSPPSMPSEGQIWIVGESPAGAWAESSGKLAAWSNGGWLFINPQNGWQAASGRELRLYDDGEWVPPSPVLNNIQGVGINSAFDMHNRLAISSEATLFSHEGAGHQVKVNKSAPGDTASLLFQTGFDGRAEMGTVGSDDFSIKVSADGATWHEGIAVDQATGKVRLPSGAEIAGALSGEGAENLPGMISAEVDTNDVTTGQTRTVIASVNSRASASGSAAMATDNCHASETRSAALASSFMDVPGNTAAAIASTNGTVAGQRSAVLASHRCDAPGARSLVAGSLDCVCATNGQGAVIASRATLNNVNGSLAMGNGASSSQADASTANRTIHLYGTNGNIQIAGSMTSSHTFSDFAEMFPNATGVALPLGTIVTEQGGAVRPAGPGDEVAGVVTGTAVITAGDTPFVWQGRYLADEWGQPIMETISDPDHEGDGPAPLIETRKENPAWNPDAPQVPRSERPAEWTRVGLLGQVLTRVAEDVAPGDRLSAVDGIGVRSAELTGLRCMNITQPFDPAKGYAVGRCLVNVRV